MTKRFGFTLAEVLITLGIIGVVAAMTIPTLIANTNGAKFRSQFKKTISTLNQAGLMSQAQYDFDYAGTSEGCKAGASDHPESVMTFCAILNGTLTGQTYYADMKDIKRSNNGAEESYKVIKRYTLDGVTDGATPTGYHAYTLADGSIVGFKKGAYGCELPIGSQLTGDLIKTAGNHPVSTTTGSGADAVTTLTGGLGTCLGFIDVNGATLPNKEVTCTDDTKNTAAELVKVETPCTVKNDANHMTDVFPIVFHDATVEPASAAAKYVLTTSK